MLYPIWINNKWTEKVTSIIPTILGFSIGSMSIIFILVSIKRFRHFTEYGKKDSYYMECASRFLYFICLQLFVLISAICLENINEDVFLILNFLGCWIFVYSLTSIFGIALTIFEISQLLNDTSDLEE
jgi:hypothetical protein